MQEKVTVIIPNYNGKHFMEPCLSSLEKQTFRSFRVLVVDNASTDGSWNLCGKVSGHRGGRPGSELRVQQGGERGHPPQPGSVRAPSEQRHHRGSPLPGGDGEGHPHLPLHLLRQQPDDPDVPPHLLDSAGDFYTILGWGFGRGKDHPADSYTAADRVFTACAGAAIYRRAVFGKIGYFDEAHFAYLEDIDIGYRARIFGWKNTYCPTALVYHVGSGTSGSKYNSFKVKLSARNSVYVNYKNMPLLQLAVNFPPLLAGCLVKYSFSCGPDSERTTVKASWRGFARRAADEGAVPSAPSPLVFPDRVGADPEYRHIL